MGIAIDAVRDIVVPAIRPLPPMPILEGSPGEIGMAGKIRVRIIRRLMVEMAVKRMRYRNVDLRIFDAGCERMLDALLAKTEAAWWVNNRSSHPHDLGRAAYRESLEMTI